MRSKQENERKEQRQERERTCENRSKGNIIVNEMSKQKNKRK